MARTPQQIIVGDHIAALRGEADAERLAGVARVDHRGASLRTAVGRGLIGLGEALARGPRTEDPCADTGGGHAA